VDEVRRAVLFVYAHMTTYALVVVGAFSLFAIVYSWPVPVLGAGVFSILFAVHVLAYAMMRAPIGEAGLTKYFLALAIAYGGMVAGSVGVLILAGP